MRGFILLGIGATIGIGLIQYVLGKKNIPKNYGVIIPIVYLISRLSLTAIAQKNNWGVSVIGAVVISHIYYRLFELARPKQNDAHFLKYDDFFYGKEYNKEVTIF